MRMRSLAYLIIEGRLRLLAIVRMLKQKLLSGIDGSIEDWLNGLANSRMPRSEDPSRKRLHALGKDLVLVVVTAVDKLFGAGGCYKGDMR